jgi:primosomal protein N' (replication factor Y)
VTVSFLPKGYALVEVVPLGGAPGAYTYAVPPQFVAQMTPGRRVLVPFGARRHTGIVLGPGIEAAEGPLREIEGVADSESLITPEILALVRWAADYYGCSLSLALRSALPPGADAQETSHAVLSITGQDTLAENRARPGDRRALRAIESGESQVLAPGTLKRLVREGLVTLEREVSIGGTAPMVEVVVRRELATAPVIPARHRSIRAVWDLLAVTPRVPFSELQQQVPSARDVVKRLAKRGLVSIEQVAFNAAHTFGPAVPPPALTDEQQAALTALEAALGQPGGRTFLLEGVTGSGKTEVYLRLIASARARGGHALVMVPEIALTPQLSSRFRARFGAEVAVLHSGLTDRDRLTEWHRIRRGEASIVVGARSAVFAPLEKPTVVIVDEEHDPSFKQGEGLRYHGRDLAVVRGSLARALVVLGSATPSLETVHNAERGRYGHIRLTRRIDSRPMPAVEIVDLKGRVRSKIETSIQPSDLLSAELVVALRETVARKEQAIVFLNRRGHSTALLCRDCGQVRRCTQCSVAMTWHERRGRLVCHYCGAREPTSEACHQCHSTRLLYAGAGTEKLEEELVVAVPGTRISRLDRDTAGTATRLEGILSRFGAGEIDILVGTQMVAKGHDFPGVTLVGVLLADAALHQPDFRAAERTAQLLNQVSGRAGRGTKPGRVLLQAFAPEAMAIRTALTHDYASFARAELAERETAQYPPFRRLCLLRIDGEDEAATAAEAAAVKKSLEPLSSPELDVLGPAPMSLARLRGRYRFQVLLKATRPSVLREAVVRLKQRRRPAGGIRMAIDIDPVDML